MREFLKSIGLIQTFTITLNCPKAYFLNTLRENVSDDFEFFESFRKGKAFKGTVSHDSFSFRFRRRNDFGVNYAKFAKLKGTVRSHHDRTVVDVEVGGLHWYFVIFFGFAIITYIGVLFSIAFGDHTENNMGSWVYLFILVHAGIMIGIPYFLLRRGVNGAGREIEKELYFLVRNYMSEPVNL